jgi:hypothetical protein
VSKRTIHLRIYKCGCHPTGKGTKREPLAIAWCPQHAQPTPEDLEPDLALVPEKQ